MNGNWRFVAIALIGVITTVFGWLHFSASKQLSTTTAMAGEAKACNAKQDVEIDHLKDTVQKVDRMEQKQADQGEAIQRIETHLQHMVKTLDKLAK